MARQTMQQIAETRAMNVGVRLYGHIDEIGLPTMEIQVAEGPDWRTKVRGRSLSDLYDQRDRIRAELTDAQAAEAEKAMASGTVVYSKPTVEEIERLMSAFERPKHGPPTLGVSRRAWGYLAKGEGVTRSVLLALGAVHAAKVLDEERMFGPLRSAVEEAAMRVGVSPREWIATACLERLRSKDR